MQLRNYQSYAVKSVIEYFTNGGTGSPLVAMPTGTGKSPTIGGLIHELITLWGDLRIMVVSHVKEIVEQDYKAIKRVWPHAPAGIFSAGLGKKETRHPIIVGGIGSVANCPLYFGHIDILLVDECHLISMKDSSQYRTFIDELKKVNPKLVVVGFTATKYRMGQGLLTDGDNPLFTDIICDMTTMENFNWFLDEGFLCRLRPVATKNEFDITGVRTVAGEYHQGDLQKAVDKSELTERIVTEAIAMAGERQHWMVFASGVAHTIHVAEELCRQGINATYVHSNTKDFKMSDDERDQRIADFKAGKYVAIVNNGILTTGFDYPGLDFILMLRKTKSIPLWVQMLGRGTRPDYCEGFDLNTKEGRLDAIRYSTKPYCLVADFAGNAKELGPINNPRIPKAKGKKEVGDAPIRICLNCGTYNWAGATSCDFCGHEFPRVLQLQVKAATDALIDEGKKEEKPIEVKIFNVQRVEYHPHMKPGKPMSIKVTYYCGTRRFPEWVGLEHEGAMRARSRAWWRERSGEEPPMTTIEALREVQNLKEPTQIHVRLDTDNPQIIKYEY